MQQKTKVVVLGAVFDQKNRLLITQRFDPQVQAAHLAWDLPGGTVEFGEDPKTTLSRELLEEVGLEVVNEGLLPDLASKVWDHEDFTMHALVLCYRCRLTKGDASPKDKKIAAVEWVQVNDLDGYKFLPTTKVFIDILRKKNKELS